MLSRIRRRGECRAIADRLCGEISSRSRAGVFFGPFKVADTIDGRFDLVVVHAWLVAEELRNRQQVEVLQWLMRALCVRFDEALRELGVGDIGIGRRMKKMVSALYGRFEAYSAASDEAALATAIHRNVYRGAPDGVEAANAFATYCISARTSLAQSRPEAGEIDFGPLPADAG